MRHGPRVKVRKRVKRSGIIRRSVQIVRIEGTVSPAVPPERVSCSCARSLRLTFRSTHHARDVSVATAGRWEAEDADTLICEIQINLDALYYMRPPPVTNETSAPRPPGALNRARADYISYRDLTAR